MPYHVVVIGGGITGLSAAFAVMAEAQKTSRTLQCTVIEQDSRWGGKILTHTIGGLLIEGGPDSFLTTKPAALELCRKLGLEHRLLPTNPLHNKTFAYCRGALRELPQGLLTFQPRGIGTLMKSGLLSPLGILRMAAERFWPSPRNIPEDESLSDFFSRRFGHEAFVNLLEPLVAGIYAGDAAELSIQATFPRFRELERVYGSIFKGMKASRHPSSNPSSSPTRMFSMFMSLRGGLGELIQTLVSRLASQKVILESSLPVREINIPKSPDDSIDIIFDHGRVLQADAVILSTPAFCSAKLLRHTCEKLATVLDEIPYASTATVSFAYKTEQIRSAVRGFGFVVPRREQRALLAATWTSLKWQNRSPPEDTLIRCYLGGRGRESFLDLDDAQLGRVITRELKELAGIHAEPTVMDVHRWDRGMPQYVLGHRNRLTTIQSLLKTTPGLYLAGAAFRGIGIPDCIQDGIQTGQTAVQELG
ncbi:MAG: protoporphyrinogen oxidase, partial [Nitrospirales bacterium]|nr:protoporphyrinogen oxidase [Nitrospirales bacterium]